MLPKLFRSPTLVITLLFVSPLISAQKTSEILWDNYGVPHVYARNTQEMYYGFGWSQMHNHANLLLQLYGQARGRAAEYWGEKYLASDKQTHLFNLPQLAKEHYVKQDKEYKPLLDAFVAGINAYAAKYPKAIDSSMRKVLPITPQDVLAHSTRVICLEFLAGSDIANVRRALGPGSNAYAIAPSRSASKNAMLLSNPHLLWNDFYIFFEAHLTSPGFEAYGVSLIGQPALNIAFNNNLGWTHTVNTIDATDRYELKLQDNGYLLDGEVKGFETKTATIKVLQPNGKMRTENMELRYTVHGPVMSENGKAYAIKVAGLENAALGAQYHKMGKAKTWIEFEAALKMMQNPMFNVIYADKAGNILYLFNGNVPKRNGGDWSFWNNTIDGSLSKNLWTSYHSYEELPRLFNPSTGFVQNANDAPWTATYPIALNNKDFPAYMAPQVMPLRPQRAVNMIKEDTSITFEELVSYKMNTGVEAADRYLDDLFAAVQMHPDSGIQKAVTVLQNWDRATNNNSRGAMLFTRWYDLMNQNTMFGKWNPELPVTSPDGFRDARQAVELLKKAAAEVEKTFGSLDVAWGEVNRFGAGKFDEPGNGGPGGYGIFRTMQFARTATNKIGYAVHGDTYVAVTEFGKKVKAQVLLSYGNATQPGSKHIGDQLPLLSKKMLRPALLEKADVIKNLEKREPLIIKAAKPF